MEIVAFASRGPGENLGLLESSSLSKRPCLFEPAQQFFSTKMAYELLESKKFVRLQPWSWSERSSTCFKTCVLGLFLLSVWVAQATFLGVANAEAVIDHSLDVITPYTCMPVISNCLKKYGSKVTPSGYWIDHTQDRMTLNVDAGLKAMLPVAILPTAAVLLIYGLIIFGNRLIVLSENSALEQEWRRFALQKSILHATTSIDATTPASFKIILELISLNVFPERFLTTLSFLQIKELKLALPQRFQEMLEKQHFSENQCLLWHKIVLMLKANAEDLTQALRNSQNSALLNTEPRAIEFLIQELEPTKFTDDIQSILIEKVKALSPELQAKSSHTLMQAFKLISARKCSFEQALQWKDWDEADGSEINLRLTNAERQPVNLKVSKQLLAQTSSVFRGLFEDLGDEHVSLEQVPLLDIDADDFLTVIEALKTQKLLWHEKNLGSLLQIIDHYDFAALQQHLEIELCTHLHEFDWASNQALQKISQSGKLEHLKHAMNVFFIDMLPEAFGNSFDVNIFAEQFSIALKFDLQQAQVCLIDMFHKHLHSLPSSSIIDLLFNMATSEFEKGAFQIFAKVSTLFEKNPALLKDLWEKALQKKWEPLQEWIVTFCEKDESYTYLAFEPIIPSIPVLSELIIQ